MTKFSATIALTAMLVPVVGGGSPTGSAVDPTPTFEATEATQRVVPDRPSVSWSPEVTVVGASGDRWAAVHDALGRFRAAGLLLPDLEIQFHTDVDECGGHDGLFQAHRTPWRLLVCSDLAFVVPHELAHAWEASNLTDDDRRRYLKVRGLTEWDDQSAPWAERGVEDAAFIVQQNLTATSPPLTSPTWVERTTAFELLTGRISPLLIP